jgi:hypothetical protein
MRLPMQIRSMLPKAFWPNHVWKNRLQSRRKQIQVRIASKMQGNEVDCFGAAKCELDSSFCARK